MGNIVKFPTREEAPAHAELNAGAIEADEPPRTAQGGRLAWPLRALRLPVYLVLYWLRLPVMVVCNLVSVPGLLAFLAGLFLIDAASPHRPIVWFLGGMSFAAFVIGWLYDALLTNLAPEGLDIPR